ncbi:MAG TPA: alpha/beta hydrolase [Longimicrobiales bacterium]|nr:alpha/beta hydrolase [Longimicrobiales bacterium]
MLLWPRSNRRYSWHWLKGITAIRDGMTGPCIPLAIRTWIVLTALLPAALLHAQSPGKVLPRAPALPDASARYLLYLHGQIVEDQGVAPVSPQFGSYEYRAIVGQLADSGFTVISEARAPNTDVRIYADSVLRQIRRLLANGITAHHITVVGASKGSVIAMLVSTRLPDPVRYVLLANCGDDILRRFRPRLHGDVLSIYEASDPIGASCRPLFQQSPDIGQHDEIRLQTGLKHGFLYRPLPEWIGPTIAWARRP